MLRNGLPWLSELTFFYCDKTLTKDRLGGKGMSGLQIIVRHLGKPKKDLKARDSPEAGTEAEIMKECFLLACSPFLVQLAFKLQPKTTFSGMVLPIVDWVLSNQLLINKMSHRYACWSTWWRKFFSWSSLFPDDYSMCQVHKTDIKSQLLFGPNFAQGM